MAESKFNDGDIVTLKSGGPDMTISEILTKKFKLDKSPAQEREVNTIKTKWFDGTKLEYGEFKEPELELATQTNDPHFS